MTSDTYDLYRLAQDYLAAANPREAVATLDHALREVPGDRALRRLLARALFDFAALRRAELVVRELLEDDPTDEELLVLLAHVLRRAGRRDESAAVTKLLGAMAA